MNHRLSVVSPSDLNGPKVEEIVDSFNRRLTRRMTFSRVGISQHKHRTAQHDRCLQGGVKVKNIN